MKTSHKHYFKGIVGCASLAALCFALVLIAMKLGSISVSYKELFSGLFLSYDERVAIIYDLRFPRIITALLGGAALSLSGLFLQATLKNPLADPGIIGISGGAYLAATIVAAAAPALYFFVPLFAFLGGIAAFAIIYVLAWKGTLDPVRIILIGVAVAAVFDGFGEVFKGLSNRSGVELSVSGLSQLRWTDVYILTGYSLVSIAAALILTPACNLLALEDKTVRGLGVNVDRLRLIISAAAVFLVSGVTAVVGTVGFVALIVPHMSRRLVGSDHRVLAPFCLLMGGFVLLLADTLGRCITPPGEISASIIMSIVGGPFFILLLKRGDRSAKY